MFQEVIYCVQEIFNNRNCSCFLTACGSQANSKGKEEDSSADTEKAQSINEPENKRQQEDENEVKDGPLTIADQWTKEDDGTKVTLKKIAKLDKLLDLEPIYMTIQDVKLLEREKDGEILNTIQIMYSAENISDKEIMFRGIETVTTNTKQQLKTDIDNLSDNYNDGEYYGKVKNDGTLILPYNEENFDDLKSIKIYTHDVWDNNQADKYHDAVIEEVNFN